MAVTPTIINSEDQIYLAGSPIHIRLHNLAMDINIQLAVMELYIWSGNLNTPPPTANYTFKSTKISAKDNYIAFQISEQISSHINATRFVWNSGSNFPMVRGEGVFFQIKYQIDEETPVELPTNFATNGYRFDYEQVGDIAGALDKQPYLGLLPIDYANRNYSKNIVYRKRDFDLTQALGVCTTETMITSISQLIINGQCQMGGRYLVAYINRLGLFDYFTPFGKATKQIKIDAETNPRLYRNPKGINNSVVHSKRRGIESTEQTYTINTGYLTEPMISQIEEVIYSPLVYLIEFTGEIYKDEQVGITVDSTTITVDSTIYTVDNTTIDELDVGFYSTYKQIPVTNENNDFTFKSRQYDKGKINYDLTFKSTTDKINNVR
jgi:hypothetical protein